MSEFNSDDHHIYYYGQESSTRNGIAIIVNKRVQNTVLRCSLKNNRMIFVHFQGKPFSITVIQVCAPTSNPEEAEVEWFYKDLQDLLELIHTKDILFIIGNLNAKVGCQETPGVTGKFGLGVQNEAAVAAKSLQLCPTLCDPIDGSPPGSPVPGILQARTLEQSKANRVLPSKHTGHSKHPLLTTQEKTLHMEITRWSTPKSD